MVEVERMARLLTVLGVVLLVATVALSQEFPVFAEHPTSSIEKAGDMVPLSCAASEGVHLTRWYRNGVLVGGEGNEFVIASFREEFAGNYTCKATVNGVGTITSAIARVQLATLTADPPGDMDNPVQVTAQVNTPHILTCGDITSTPPVHYTWTGPTVSLFPTLGIIQGIEGKLYFQLVTAAVEDTYVCRVSNDHLQVSQVGYIQLTAVAADDDSAATSSPSPRQMMAIPEDLVVSEGDSASFQCIIGGSPLPTASDIVWSYPSDTALLLQNNAVIYIRSASLADAGQYSCSVTGLAIYSASLTVLVPPIISVTPLPLYDPVFGDPTSIVCGSNNTVVGEWVWYHNGVRLADASTDTLTIDTAQIDTAHTTMNDGLYQCFAYNEAGNNSSTARVAVVTYPANLTQTILPTPRLLFTGTRITYTCVAFGAPPPEIIWLHDGGVVDTAVTMKNSETRETSSVLEFPELSVGDSGVYKCRAVNEIDGVEVGREEGQARLKVIAPTLITRPNVFESESVLEEERTATIPCLAMAQEGVVLNFTWYKDNLPLSYDGTRVSLTTGVHSANISISIAEPGDAGIYQCEVVTLYEGLESVPVYSAHLYVTTTPKLLIPPKIFPVTRITSSSFEVKWYFPGLDSQIKLESYTVSYREVGSVVPVAIFTLSVESDNSIIISSSDASPVKPYTTYEVSVVANYKTGERLSESVTVVTSEDVPGAPGEVTGTGVNFTTVFVKWEPPTEPNGIITNYTIRYREESTTSTYRTSPLSSNSTHHYIIGLETTSSYLVEVAASTSVGLGPYSEPVAVSTEQPGGRGGSPVYESVWFIVVMFVVALVMLVGGVLFVGGVRYAVVSHSGKKKKYNFQSKVELPKRNGKGSSTRSLTEDDMRDYDGRGSRMNGESSNIGLLLDGREESESSLGAKYPYEPSLSTASHISSVAPAYINPPSFREAVKSLHSARLSPAYSGSTLDQAPPSTAYTGETESSFWLDSSSKTRILQQMVDASPSPARSYQPSPLQSSPPPPPIPTAHRPGIVPPPPPAPPLPQSPTHSEHKYASLSELDYNGTGVGEKGSHSASPVGSGYDSNGYNRLSMRPSSQQRVRTNSTPQYRTTSPQNHRFLSQNNRFSPLNHTGTTAASAAVSSSQDVASPYQGRSSSHTMSSSHTNQLYVRSSSQNMRSNTAVGVGAMRGSVQRPMLAKTSSQPNFATFV